MENLCEKYEKEIGKYKKDLEELKNGTISESTRDNILENTNQQREEIGSYIEKCDACVNTDDLSIDDLTEILNKIDKDMVIENKSN